jgi:hypothetical protein
LPATKYLAVLFDVRRVTTWTCALFRAHIPKNVQIRHYLSSLDEGTVDAMLSGVDKQCQLRRSLDHARGPVIIAEWIHQAHLAPAVTGCR